MITMESDISKRIEELMKALGLVKNSFAIKLGITPQGLGAIINGRNQPGYDVLRAILTETDVNSEWLFTGKGEMFVDKAGTIVSEPPEPYLVTGRLLGKMEDQDTIILPLLDAKAAASFMENIYGSMVHLETGKTYRVIKIPGRNYNNAMVMEIVGDSMLPNFKDGMKVIVREVVRGRWDTATGIHAISLKSGMFTIKRIISNRNNIMILRADNPKTPEELDVQIADILALFRVGEIVYAPPVQDIE
jgi:phage repressor protein C with HTH and peptisase S24 domain